MTEDTRPPSSPDTSQDFVILSMDDTREPAADAGPSQAEPATPQRTSDSKRNSLASTRGSATMRSRPISTVVTEAFEHSPATSQVDPELVKIIRAEVMEQVMKAVSQQPVSSPTLGVPLSAQESQTVYPPPPASPSPTFDNAQQVFTPPSPEPFVATGGDRGFTSPSPDIAPSDSGSQFSQHSRSSIGSPERLRNANMPLPGKNDSESTIRNQSPASPDRRRSRRESDFKRSLRDQDRSRRRDSKASDAGYDGTSRSRARSEVTEEDTGETVIEKMWKPLFVDGIPTQRLNQFLRGLALHLIDDYEPKGSLVVTPKKMLRFLNETRVNEELYPWDVIFGGKMALPSLSVMYRRLVCEHHLVQGNHQEHPNIPGLTPNGFAGFMTCLIQAYPETEFERLSTAVMNMPIANADDKKERFPKELSRRLLPHESNIEAEQRLVSSLNHEPYVLAEIKTSARIPPPPPPSAPPQSAPSRRHGQSFGERARQPYVQTSNYSSAVEDEEVGSPTSRLPIERERKPYYAKEGSGKKYENEESRSQQPQYRSERSESDLRPKRSDSGMPAPAPAPYPQNGGQSEPVDIPQQPRMPHRQSFGQANMLNMLPPGMASSYNTRSRDTRRPSPTRNSFARSGTDLSDAGSAFTQSSNLHPVQSEPPGLDTGDERYGRYNVPIRPRNDRASNSAFMNEDTRSERDFNTRSSKPRNIYDAASDYGGMGGPVGGPNAPGASSYRERPPPPPNTDESRRRRSEYIPPDMLQGGGDGGTDGYGSFADRVNGKYSQQPQQPYGSSLRD